MSAGSRIVVVVRGPGHHDRAAAATSLLSQLATLGPVSVSTELRPRLADDVEALLDAGAHEVTLTGRTSAGRFSSGDPDAAVEDLDGIVVRLVAGPGPVQAEVVAGGSDLYERVVAIVDDWNAARG